jgi:hypothetical protein
MGLTIENKDFCPSEVTFNDSKRKSEWEEWLILSTYPSIYLSIYYLLSIYHLSNLQKAYIQKIKRIRRKRQTTLWKDWGAS